MMLANLVTILALSVAADGTVSADSALAGFELKVQAVGKFLEQPRKIALVDGWPPAPGGRIYKVAKVQLVSSAYDVQRTDSLVSPYVARLDLTILQTENARCGDVKGYRENVGWSQAAKAIEAADRGDCYGEPSRGGPYVLRFSYAHQGGRWVLKAVTIPDANNGDALLGASLGLSRGLVPNFDLQAFNTGWSVFNDAPLT